MNSLQLAQRLARNLAVEDPFNLPADAALDVLSAINAGLNQFYRNMPGVYKRTTLSYTAQAPLDLSVNFHEKYSRLVDDNTFASDVFGCTIRFKTSAADTVITGPNNVLDDWLGAPGIVQATIYADVIPIQDVIERVIGAVRCFDNSQDQPTTMIRDERLRGGRALWWNFPYDQWSDTWSPIGGGVTGSVGRPRYYFLEPMGSSQGAEPEFVLRMVPFPDKDYRIKFEAELSTQRIQFSDLTTPKQIAVGDAYLDDLLIPLCEAELITSPFWADKEKVNAVLSRQQTVLEKKMPQIPTDLAPPGHLIGTPGGW